jgi:uncharacterized membrane protein
MSRHRRFREHLPFAPKHERFFRWRGHEVSRLEGFSDAVFAFAVTLLVVALEVPHTFDGLRALMGTLPSFVACFTLLMLFWNGHYRFFRRYGLEDGFTRFVTLLLLLFILFSVYPLKFLFSAWLDVGEHRAHIETLAQLKYVFRIYGLGFASIWGLFAVLHWHALRRRHALQLSAVEVIITRSQFCSYLIDVAVCLVSIALTTTNVSPGMPGWIYTILAPLLTFNGWWHGRQILALTPTRTERERTRGEAVETEAGR